MRYGTRLILLIALGVSAAAAAETRLGWTPILGETFGYGPDTPASVDLERLEQGCPRRDCIPAIDDPAFVPAAEADFLQPDDGSVTARDSGGGETFQATRLYWFAWYTFHPNTAVATGKAD